jgi:hypothetical protein
MVSSKAAMKPSDMSSSRRKGPAFSDQPENFLRTAGLEAPQRQQVRKATVQQQDSGDPQAAADAFDHCHIVCFCNIDS